MFGKGMYYFKSIKMKICFYYNKFLISIKNQQLTQLINLPNSIRLKYSSRFKGPFWKTENGAFDYSS